VAVRRSSPTVSTGSAPGSPRARATVGRSARLSREGRDGHEILRKRPRQERARATFDAVLDGAAEVITEHGYAAMTTNAVARRAGISIGSLYQYFPDKTAILVCLLERHIREMQPVIAESLEALAEPTRPLEDALRETVLRLVAAHDHHGPRLQQVLSEEVPHPPSIQRLRQKLEAGYVAEVARILSGHGELRQGQPEVVAQVFVVVVEAVTVWLAHGAPGSVDRRAYAGEVARMLGAYLRSAPGGSG
jgi:AcrR family transcriptional regulator